ncbi:hypothetical protein A0R60_2285 [Enterobacter asburiae]|nr:hypothetical protein A0R60_2285 [Enterobacter asburiae]
MEISYSYCFYIKWKTSLKMIHYLFLYVHYCFVSILMLCFYNIYL